MDARECRQLGYRHGYGMGSCNAGDAPVDCTESDAYTILGEADEHHRQFSPFEFYAYEMNGSSDPEEQWEAYESGLASGFKAGWRSVRPWPGTIAAERWAKKQAELADDLS